MTEEQLRDTLEYQRRRNSHLQYRFHELLDELLNAVRFARSRQYQPKKRLRLVVERLEALAKRLRGRGESNYGEMRDRLERMELRVKREKLSAEKARGDYHELLTRFKELEDHLGRYEDGLRAIKLCEDYYRTPHLVCMMIDRLLEGERIDELLGREKL
jgi:predicted nuclease with TOPRIM domain